MTTANDTNPFATPNTPRGRLLAAAALAADTIAAQYATHLSQSEEPMVFLVCVQDCEVGRALIVNYLGARAPGVLSGPVVLPQTVRSFLASIGSDKERKEIAAMFDAAGASALRLVWAVNGSRVQIRALPAPSPEAIEACATPEDMAAWLARVSSPVCDEGVADHLVAA